MFYPNSKDFSENRLRNLYKLSLRKSLEPIFYKEENKYDKFIIWRHDVDIELEPVKKIAQIEYEEGIKSTYFLMIRSKFYNLLNSEGEAIIEILHRYGHEIGLHCDLNLSRLSDISYQEVEEIVRRDFSVLDKYFGKNVFKKIVSFHNPPEKIIMHNFDSFYSTYQKKFFKEIKYLSDSNRLWRSYEPEYYFEKSNISKYSILLHPIIWYYKGVNMRELLDDYIINFEESIKHKFKNDDINI